MPVGLSPAPSPEQQLLIESTCRYVDDHLPLTRVRQLAESGTAVDAQHLVAGAELGWFSLLVDPNLGGGSVSGNGLADLAAIAAELGARLNPTPLVGANVVARALSESGAGSFELSQIVTGAASATWIPAWHAAAPPLAGCVQARPHAGGYLLDGRCFPVVDGFGCDVVLVSAQGPTGVVHVLVPPSARGLVVQRGSGLDLTRRAAAIEFDQVAVPASGVVSDAESAHRLGDELLALAAVLSAAQLVGALHADFELAVAYAKDRIAFGRPIGSFQAVKHQLADASLIVEMAKATVWAAAEALGSGQTDGIDLAHVAKAFVAERAIEVTQTCFQVFGGIGYTWEHDHHLFMRRVAADASSYGDAAWHRSRMAGALHKVAS